MRIYESVEEYTRIASPPTSPIAFTIGNFDGVHRGHVALLQFARKVVGPSGEIVVLTFTNHPSQVVKPDRPREQQLCTVNEKLHLLSQAGVDTTILIPFTMALATLTPLQFIQFIRKYIPFAHLILGYNAKLGKDREGTQPRMEAIAKQCGFSIHYMPEYRVDGQVVSSSRIRELLRQGMNQDANFLLGKTTRNDS
jgi:riboflavin kinase / FMN adenylyltransferase